MESVNNSLSSRHILHESHLLSMKPPGSDSQHHFQTGIDGNHELSPLNGSEMPEILIGEVLAGSNDHCKATIVAIYIFLMLAVGSYFAIESVIFKK
jgi:hypothetical protein